MPHSEGGAPGFAGGLTTAAAPRVRRRRSRVNAPAKSPSEGRRCGQSDAEGALKAVERMSWLQAGIDGLVSRYQNEARDFRKQAFRLRILSVCLVAVVTVLLTSA